MSSTGANQLTIFGGSLEYAVVLRNHPRGTLNLVTPRSLRLLPVF
jgi:hypothetical protein